MRSQNSENPIKKWKLNEENPQKGEETTLIEKKTTGIVS